MIDFFDVILPPLTADVRPIYLDDRGELYCVVSAERYQWASKWRWKPIRSRGAKTKIYAYRTTRVKGRHVSIWLHKEVCLLVNGLPPTEDHVIADHLNGNSLVDTDDNFRWATRSQNNRNLNGVAAQQLRLAIATGNVARVVGAAGKALAVAA